jgi:hypothetical protein
MSTATNRVAAQPGLDARQGSAHACRKTSCPVRAIYPEQGLVVAMLAGRDRYIADRIVSAGSAHRQ